MAIHRVSLTDAGQPSAVDLMRIDSGDVPGTPAGWFIEKRRLHDGLSHGVDVVEVNAGRLRVIVVPTRGMGLWRAWMDGCELGWRSPVRGPVHPAFVPLAEASGLGWLDGFDELMCRCGLESLGSPEHDEHGRLRYGLHGRIANRPAQFVEVAVDDAAGTISLAGVVEESRFHFQKLRLRTTYTLRFDATELAWRDEVENFGGTPAKMQMMYHVNIGLPFLGVGSQVVAPVRSVVPGSKESTGDAAKLWTQFDGPTSGYVQQVFYNTPLADESGQSLVLLKNPAETQAVQIAFNVRQLPCFTLWKNCVAAADGYVTGLEPGTSFPNPRSAEEAVGRVVSLSPGARWSADLALDLLSDTQAVAAAQRRINDIQSSQVPQVYLEMQ